VTDLAVVERLGLLVVRPGALLMTTPIFGATFAPPMVRAGLLLLITLALAPIVTLPPDLGGVSTTLVAGRELLIGLGLSMAIRVLVAGAELAGHLAGFQIGFAYASLVDPQSGARNAVLSALYANLALMVFLAVDGHHQLLQALAASYAALPVGAAAGGATGDLAPLVARTMGTVFVIGVRIAAPIVLVLLIVEVALGLLSRAAPMLNLMVNAAPLRLFTGLAVLATTLAVVPDVVRASLVPVFQLAARLADALR
jgi:flagellar biosynthetic protein FliR